MVFLIQGFIILFHLKQKYMLSLTNTHKKITYNDMGFTPLEGLVMGTRCGDLDPDIVAYLMQKEKLSRKEIFHLLERESGLKGISGVNDMRDIISRMKKGNKRAKLAFDIFCHRIIKYLGAYIAVLNGTDCIVFTAGIDRKSTRLNS